MVDQVEEPIYTVKVWTKNGHEWYYYKRTRTQAMEIYETLKAGKVYEDHDDDSEIECLDGSWVYQVKVKKNG